MACVNCPTITMTSRTTVRTAAIVGRPNVGKSALFNRFAGRRISIVHDQPGVTRDRIAADCNLVGAPFTVVDTGGIGSNPDDTFSDAIEQEADLAMEAAELIVFVVDAHEGLTPVDQRLAEYLRKADKPVFVVANKVDDQKHRGFADEFASLGFADFFAVSATHNHGIMKLVAAVSETLPAADPDADTASAGAPIRITLVGRPNVGKSSMVNALLEDDRTIVSEVAGTTRDAVDVPFSHGGTDYVFIDTAGLRARNKQDSTIEIFSGMRSKASIKRADICALIVDAAQGATSQDRKIAGLIGEANKPCFIVANKFDLYHPDAPKSDRLAALQEDIAEGLFFIPYAPVVAASAKTGESVRRLFFGIEQVRKAAWEGLNTGALNRLMQEALAKNPPPAGKSGKRFKLLYATMAKVPDPTRPVPVADFILFCNQEKLLPQSYLRYLEHSIRKQCAYTGIPIRFVFREREARGKRGRR